MFNQDKIKAILQQQFEKFNAQIKAELDVLRPPSNANITEFDKLTFISENALLLIKDADKIAEYICKFEQISIAWGKTGNIYHKKNLDISNSINIDYDTNGNIRVLVKSRVQASNKTSHLMAFGSYKAIKLFGLLLTFDPKNAELIPEYSGRVVTISRRASRTGSYPKLNRAQKYYELNLPAPTHDSKTFAAALENEGYTKIELGINEVIFYKFYAGLSLWSIQKAMAKRGETFGRDTGRIIYKYLYSIYKNLRDFHIWPCDLKQENTCVKIDPSTRKIAEVKIIDFDSNAVTYSPYKRSHGENPVPLKEFFEILSKLRNEHQISSVTTQDMNIMKYQLMIEILHMCFIFSEFPYVIKVNGLFVGENTLPFFKSDVSVFLLSCQDNIPFDSYCVSNPKNVVHPIAKLLNILLSIGVPGMDASGFIPLRDRNFNFEFFLTELRSEGYKMQLQWPAEFNDQWIRDFGDQVNNFIQYSKPVPSVIVSPVIATTPIVTVDASAVDVGLRSLLPEEISAPILDTDESEIDVHGHLSHSPVLGVAEQSLNIQPRELMDVSSLTTSDSVVVEDAGIPSINRPYALRVSEPYASGINREFVPRITGRNVPHVNMSSASHITTPATPIVPPKIYTPQASPKISPPRQAPSRAPTPRPNLPVMPLMFGSKPAFVAPDVPCLFTDTSILATDSNKFLGVKSSEDERLSTTFTNLKMPILSADHALNHPTSLFSPVPPLVSSGLPLSTRGRPPMCSPVRVGASPTAMSPAFGVHSIPPSPPITTLQRRPRPNDKSKVN